MIRSALLVIHSLGKTRSENVRLWPLVQLLLSYRHHGPARDARQMSQCLNTRSRMSCTYATTRRDPTRSKRPRYLDSRTLCRYCVLSLGRRRHVDSRFYESTRDEGLRPRRCSHGTRDNRVLYLRFHHVGQL